MSTSLSRRPIQRILRSLLQGGGGGGGGGGEPAYFADAYFHIDDTTISPTGAGIYPGWSNKGSRGTDMDFADVNGAIKTNLAITTQNGLDCMTSGAGGATPTVLADSQFESDPQTTFFVGKVGNFTATPLIVDQNNNRGVGDKRHLHATITPGNNWHAFAGVALNIAVTTDAAFRVWAVQWNGDATTKFWVSGIGSVVGNAGAQNWHVGSLLLGAEDSSVACENLAITGTKTDEQIEAGIDYLATKWNAEPRV